MCPDQVSYTFKSWEAPVCSQTSQRVTECCRLGGTSILISAEKLLEDKGEK